MLLVDPKTDVNANIPNLGLAYAATHNNAKVIDQHILPYPSDRFLRVKADVVGISVKSFTANEAKRIEKLYKAKYPAAEIKSVTGFVDIQCCYPYQKWENSIDFAEPFSDKYPFPDYSLFDSFNYLKTNWQTGFWAYPIMTSQGCPYQCSFCASRNRKWLARGVANCYEELKQAKDKYGIKYFEVLDDAFNVDKKRVLEFCSLIAPLGLKWACTNGIRADKFDEETARAMKEAGCYHTGFGAESADAEVLKRINKGESFEDINKAIDTAKKYFNKVSAFFIIGLPGSTYEKDKATLAWAVKKGIRAHFSYYVPADSRDAGGTFYGAASGPGSDVYDRELQKKIYNLSRIMRLGIYSKENVVLKVLGYTLKGIPKYNFNSMLTHFVNLIRKGSSLLVKKEIS
jgi:hypothetical protein